MKKLSGVVATLALIILLCSGIFADIVQFFTWLLMLNYTQPDISFVGGIFVRLFTFAISYGLVGIVFKSIGLFNSNLMSVAYFVISALLGFALAYGVWVVEQHTWVIGIVVAVIFGLLLLYYLYLFFANQRNKKARNLPEK